MNYQTCTIADTMEWINGNKLVLPALQRSFVWELARINFPGAVLILDFFHAMERLHQLCAGL